MLIALKRPLKRIEIDPLLGPSIQKLAVEAAKGVYTLEQLAKLAYGMGIHSKKGDRPFDKSSISKLLSSKFYCGVMRYKEEEYLGNYEPLISRDLFEKVQIALTDKAKPRKHWREFYYTGLIQCSDCGGMITAEVQKGYTYYRCTKKRGACRQPYVREDKMEEKIVKLLEKVQLHPFFVEWGLKKLAKIHKEEASLIAGGTHKLRLDYNDHQQRLDNLLQLRISPSNVNGSLLSDEEYLRQKALLQEQLSLLKRKIDESENNQKSWLEKCEQTFEFSAKLVYKFRTAQSVEQKHLILKTVGYKYFLCDGELEIEYNPIFKIFSRLEPQKALSDKEKGSNVEILKFWCARRESNARPLAPQTNALSI